jgi:zinc and cadmium transporter
MIHIIQSIMNEWILLIIAALGGSVISLIGGVYLLYGKKGAAKLQQYAVPFAAGALLAASFFDLLPEALEHSDAKPILMAVLSGFIGFFLLERFLHWFHHHHDDSESSGHRSTASLIIIGDSLHNFIDGLAIGASFLVSPATGVVTTLAVAAHEIPQEIGDFGLLLARGMSRKRVLMVNFFSALTTIVGAVLVFGLGDSLVISEPLLLAITAGFFIYIAASDIIPSIHAEVRPRVANIQSLVLLVGIIVVASTTLIAHHYIAHSEEPSVEQHSHEAKDEHSHEE